MNEVLDTLTRVIDAYPGGDLYEKVTAAAREAMSAVDGATLDDYRTAREAGPGSRGYWPYVDAAGEAVADVIRKDLAERVSEYSLWWTFLSDILDLGSREVLVALGHHYLPEVGYVDASDFPGDDSDDE